ncbi:hypothetical protein AA0229_0611 [Gluconobacter cerinus NRIC 0229]|nr:hypothetical protein AA0229_0611 [Gluconobacter cerinus NRIC 0229]
MVFTGPEPETNGIFLHKAILSQTREKTGLRQNSGMVRASGIDQNVCPDCAGSPPTSPEMQNNALRCGFRAFDPGCKNRE